MMFRFFIVFLCLFFVFGTANAATLTVTKTADTNDGVCDSDCSLREAVDAALSGDTIEFSILFNSSQFIALNGTEIIIDKSLTINGTGADKITVDAGFASRIFNISGPGNTVNINGLRIASGFNSSPTNCNGGGISIVDANVNINKSVIEFSVASSNTGNACAGGGIYNQGTLNLTNSTVNNNSVTAMGNAVGGGIANGGIFTGGVSATISNSTISGNSSNNCGGGIDNEQSLTLRSVTITNNSCNVMTRASGINNGFFASTNIGNTIIAQNQDDRDTFGNFTSQGFNLIGSPLGGTTGFTQPTDQVGTMVSPIDAMLATLANNGGTTPTHALQTGSPAIDKGNSFALATDQRGQNRPVDNSSVSNATGGDGSDIGAFETLAPTAATVSIRGRVVAGKNRPVRRAMVSITDMSGNVRTVMTNAFGYFYLNEIDVGENYIITARARAYTFSPQVISLNESISDFVVRAN